MHELKIRVGRNRFDVLRFPERFEEMGKRHLLIFCRAVENAAVDKLWFVRLKRDFVGMKRRHVLALNEIEAAQLDALFDFLGGQYFHNRSVMRRWKWLWGPKDHLKNMTMEQLAFVDTFAMNYNSNPEDDGLLNLFFGACYRPLNLRFGKRLMGFVAWYARFVPRYVKKAAFKNYLALRENMVADHPHVFGGGKSDGTEVFGWQGTIIKLAKTGTFGSFKEAKKVLVPDAFAGFEMNGIEVEKIK